MDMFFLSNDDIAIALIEAKYKILGENFITATELSQFTTFIQHKFDENGLDVIIRAEGLSESDFTIENGVIAKSKECNNSLNCIPYYQLLVILMDENLFLKFFTELEVEKLKRLESMQLKKSQSIVKEKNYH